MSEIPKAYEPQAVEEKWYQFWLDQKCFVADPARVSAKRPAYSIVIPPPNVTGVLTMGHVLNNTIQDILCRKARMDGKEVLWLPGTDHAGIATQTVVERTLKKAGEIRHRDDLGREKFLERVWQWKEKHGGIIIQQLKKLGASCDWTRERFTMDEAYSRCVQKVFIELYKKGLIYRGKRMVNWCPASLTALSDEEVIMEELFEGLYYFRVEIAEEPGTFLTIATTRPETIPGDTAVAVNPKDPRYAKYIGKHVVRPLPPELPREQKLIPIIGDEHVDFEFGTGVLKVTPAHDKADFEIGQRHKLPILEIMNPDATMNDLAGNDLRGLKREEAKKIAIQLLKNMQQFEREDFFTHNVGFSERAGVKIESRLSEQWFLKYPSVEQARTCVEQAEVGLAVPSEPRRGGDRSSLGFAQASTAPYQKMRFHPQRWAKVYDHWMGDLQDWCISRQLWWGHRIPVWVFRWSQTSIVEPQFLPLEILPETKSAGRPEGKEISISKKPGHFTFIRYEELYNLEMNVYAATTSPEEAKKLEKLGFTQDPDVLDTWFSSWLWPFATMGWPEQTATLKKFYPTTDLVTGPDIIFFWVARMIMAGYKFMGQMPFRNVYFTGIIRDKQGRKMSKSLGNSPDPLDLINKYGADALRFGTMRSAPLGQDILFDEQNVELGRNFCNKLWNACRFRQLQGGKVQGEIDPKLLTSDDKWILLKLDQAIREMNTAFAEYKFSDATATLYRFFWSEYCDWYVEASKAAFFGADEKLKANTLAVIDFVLSHTLRLFHPFLPFITEELWHGMGYAEDMPENQGGKTVMFAPWPKPFDDDFKTHYGLIERDEKHIEARNEFVTQGRNLRRTANIAASKKIKFILKPARELAPHDVEVLKLLLNAETVEIHAHFKPAKNTMTARVELGDLYLPLEGLIDIEAEKARLKKELEKIEAEAAKVEQKLANPNFSQKVPPNVLAEHQQRLAEWQSKRDHVKSALAALN